MELSTSFTDTASTAEDLNDTFSTLDSTCTANSVSISSVVTSASYSGYITSFADSCTGISDILDTLPDPLNKVHNLNPGHL